MSSQADELSRNAADMARRATDILAAHVAQRRSAPFEAHTAVAEGTGKHGKKDKKKNGKKSKKAKR